ncbi:cbb3-type cytochrome c oxidase subunit I [Aliiroseovarius sp. YM-037]|uniref:cbb3-type cytochrome c oxidase subunit I n=1 Tax=Aliiroseovarius sp. YM-037 TaxID=3341728 RepID=UPI003A7F72D6
MLYALLPVALLIIVPLAEQLRRARPFMLFALVAAVYVVLAGLTVAIFRTPALLDWVTQPVTSDRTYHDTYYVVSHANFTLSLALIFAVIALITWGQTKAHALYYTRLTTFAFWGLHLSILGTAIAPVVLQTNMPRRYADYQEVFDGLNRITSLLSFAAFLFLCMLAVLLLLSIVRRISKRSHD